MDKIAKTCLLCDGTDLMRSVYPHRAAEGVGLNFNQIAVCKSCGFGRAEPLPSQEVLDEFYERGLYWEKPSNEKTLFVHQKVQAQFRVKKCLKFLKSRKSIAVLDIGAGQGLILYWLSKYLGFERVTYDFAEPDPIQSEKILGSKLVRTIRKTHVGELKANTYDMIFLNHVIEHVEEPLGFMRLIFNSLKPDGICYVETPCRDDLVKSDVFPHTLFFTPESYKHMATKLNVSISDLRTFGSKVSVSAQDQKKLFNRIKFKLYGICASKNIWAVAKFLDSHIFKYSEPADGIWVSALFKKTID